MVKNGTLHVKENGELVEYYPKTLYSNVLTDESGTTTLDTDITNLKNFKGVAETKLNTIANNATKTEKSTTNGNIKVNGTETVVYTHPTGAGNLHIPTGGSAGQILRWSAAGTAVWGADNNTTYSVATKSANGLMSKEDKTKLDGIATGANKTVLNNTVTSTSTTEAATANAVKTAYDKANHSHPYAATTHTHTKSQITDFPASLPANGGNADTVDGKHANQFMYRNPTCTTGTDYNTLTEAGFYEVIGTTESPLKNFPFSATGNEYVLVLKRGATYMKQIAFNVRNNQQKIRTMTNGTWSDWVTETNLTSGTATGAVKSIDAETSATGNFSVAFGMRSNASGMCAHVEGAACTASETCTHAEGMYSTASGNSSHAEGTQCTASGQSSHAEGWQAKSVAFCSHCEGENTEAFGETSHCEGFKTTSSGIYSHAQGFSSNKANMSDTALSGTVLANAYNKWKAATSARFAIAWGKGSHVEGGNSGAFGEYSHAEGYACCAGNVCAHAEGYMTTALAMYSHAEGYNSAARGKYSHAEGMGTTATGYIAHAKGSYTTAETHAIQVMGQFNKANSGTADRHTATNNAFVIGNGTKSAKSNAFRVTFDGKTYGLSAFNSTGADYAEYFEWLDGNPDNEDRIGHFVALDGKKIKLAESEDDYIVGIISGNQSIIGNACEDSWNDMYIRDRFDRLMYEDVEVEKEEPFFNEETGEPDVKIIKVVEKHIKLNPNYDNNIEYLPRSQRKEWGIVGMLGQIRVIDDGTCKVNGYCKPTKGGIATHTDDKSGYRVIERIDDTLIRVIMK